MSTCPFLPVFLSEQKCCMFGCEMMSMFCNNCWAVSYKHVAAVLDFLVLVTFQFGLTLRQETAYSV